jgi:hypothetical protein
MSRPPILDRIGGSFVCNGQITSQADRIDATSIRPRDRFALTLNPSPEGRGTLNSGSLLPSGEGLGMRADLSQ